MRDQKLRGIEESASSGLQNLRLFMEQKVLLLTQYLSITRTMKETFMQKKEINLIELLSKRQDCINRIQKTDLSVKKIMNTGAEELSRISYEVKSSLDAYQRSIKSLLEQIAPIDAEVMVMVKEESRGVKAELLKIRNVRHAAKGYSSNEKRIPMYMDAKR
ncbi:MAG: hypothetical protein KKD92_13660 [Proteobacteria bacterium]|nr:hypothetical protein [Pseudomonadota bacterium]